MKKVALITGGTSGIGAAFARFLAAEKFDLVLVARDEARLQSAASELQSNFGVHVETIVADLSTDIGVTAVEDRIANDDAPIDMLINNAGFGISGKFIDSPIADHVKVLRVNGEAVLRLTHVAMRVMLGRGSGDIVNVGSVAAFTPGLRPSSTYAASKAFVVALSEGLAPVLEGTGVHMSALCPGFVKTEFHTRAGIKASERPGFLWLAPDMVAAAALRDHRAGRVISVPGAAYKVIVFGVKLVPSSLVRLIARFIGRHSHKQ